MSDRSTFRDLALAIRHFVDEQFVLTSQPPTVAETAHAFGLTGQQVEVIFRRVGLTGAFWRVQQG